MGIIPDMAFLAAVLAGIAATLYSATVIIETFIRPALAMRRARRYSTRRRATVNGENGGQSWTGQVDRDPDADRFWDGAKF